MYDEKVLLDKITHLESENRRLREREADTTSVLRTVIHKMPIAAVALDANLNIMYANNSFIDLLDWQSRAAFDNKAALDSIALQNIVSPPVFSLIQGTHISGQDAIRAELNLPDGDFNISVYNIRRNELTLAMVSNLNNPEVRTTEIVARLQQTIDRNMSMIQQIASLLGEEVSQNASELSDIIKTIQYPNH